MQQKGMFRVNLAKNIGIIRKCHSAEFANLLAKLKIPDKYRLVQIEQNPDLNVSIDNKFFYPKDLDSSMEKFFEGTNHLNKWKIFLGLGLGHHLKEITERHGEHIKRILIVEKDIYMLKLAFMVHDFSKLLAQPNLIKIFAGNLPDITIHTHNFFATNSEMIHYLRSGEFLDIDKRDEETVNYYSRMKKEIIVAGENKLRTFGNDPHDSMVGLVNIINNAEHTLKNPGIIDLKGKFKGKNAILVAGGPSLQMELEELKRFKGKTFIACVDTAFKPLLKNGIKPDMVVTLERGEQIVNYYNNLEEYDLTDVVFCPLSLVDKILFEQCTEKYKMPTIVGYRTISQYNLMPVDKGRIFCGQSSALLLFNIMKLWGFSSIILVGQDLAFGEGEKTHVDGADHSIKGMAESPKMKQQLYIRGNYEERVKTLAVWDQFKKFLESDIDHFNGVVYNTAQSKKSAYIIGAVLKPLNEIKEENNFNLIKEYKNILLSEKEYEVHYQQFLDNLIKYSNWLKQAVIDIQKIKDVKMVSDKKLRQTESFVNHEISFTLVSHIAQSVYLQHQLERRTTEENEDDIHEFCKKMIDTYVKYAQWPIDLIDEYLSD